MLKALLNQWGLPRFRGGAGSDYDYVTIKYFETGRWRGDCNGDGAVGPENVVYLINYLFRDGDPPDPLAAGDCSCDDSSAPGDVVFLTNYLFRNGPPPDCWQ